MLALDAAGLVTLTEGGAVYQFDASGKLSSTTTVADGKKPATPTVSYRANGLPDRITDPVAGGTVRTVQFVYGGDTTNACTVPSTFSAPRPGFLCRIIYLGQTGVDEMTQLFYNEHGQVAEI